MTATTNQDDVAQKIIDSGHAGLWQQMDVLLGARLQSNPTDVMALRRQALSYRQRGDLAEAANSYDRLAALEPDNRSSLFLRDVCRGDSSAVSFADDEVRPAPFLVRRDFLPASARQELLALLEQHQSELVELGVEYRDENGDSTTYQVDHKERFQLGLHRAEDVRQIIQPRIDAKMPEFLAAFGLDVFPVKGHSLRLDVTPDGGHGVMHQDIVHDGVRLSYLYYFHTHPKSFTGGDFLLFDQDVKNGIPSADQFTMLRHEDNKLIVFLPYYFHQPTRVRARSAGMPLIDSRLSVSGFVFEDLEDES